MKKYLLLLCMTYAMIVKSQTDVPLNVPGIGHGATINDPMFRFSYSGYPVGHYGLGWYIETGGSPSGYLSGFAGLRFFTEGTPKMSISSNGNIGLGQTNPKTLLSLKRMVPTGDQISIYRSDTTPNLDIYSVYNGSDDEQSGSFGYGVRPSSDAWQIWEKGLTATWMNLFTVEKGGNVGIGTAVPKEKLSVNGNIRAREVKVENGNWPDFVFAKEYDLPSLAETEKHIHEKGHLIGIPSAVEVKTKGIDLGDMNAKLLQKIEELTLHLIEQGKKIDALKVNIEDQQKEIKSLKSKMN